VFFLITPPKRECGVDLQGAVQDGCYMLRRLAMRSRRLLNITPTPKTSTMASSVLIHWGRHQAKRNHVFCTRFSPFVLFVFFPPARCFQKCRASGIRIYMFNVTIRHGHVIIRWGFAGFELLRFVRHQPVIVMPDFFPSSF